MNPTAPGRMVTRDELEALPPGPLSSAELATAVSTSSEGPRVRRHYRRLWRGMYRHKDQPDDLMLRTIALARSRPDGVLCGRSAALLWGDDTAPADTVPEIWLPTARSPLHGRIYRSGPMPPKSVTERDGMRTTSLLRTCQDLAKFLTVEDAVVAVERMCARNPSLRELLHAVVSHPAGRHDDPLRRVVTLLDPRSISAEESRVRAVLANAGFDGFGYGNQVLLGRTRVELPLADPVLRCAVFLQPVRGPRRSCDEATARELRRAGWTLMMVRAGHAAALRLAPASVPEQDAPGQLAPSPDARSSAAPGLPAPSSTVPALAPADSTCRSVGAVSLVLRTRWPATCVRAPIDVAPVADPHGIWAG